MILATSKWEHCFSIGDGECYQLIIENPVVFREYIQTLKNQLEDLDGHFVLSEKIKRLKLKDYILLIDNPLSLDSSNKKISTKLASLLKNFAIAEDLVVDTAEALSAIEKYAEKISDAFEYNIKYDEPDILSIIKTLNFEIDMEYETPLEKLAEYLNVLHSLCSISTFIIVNATSYFSSSELNDLITFCKSQKHSIILINSYQKQLNINDLKTYIIDEDCCEIM